jgi:hypothetical protein
MNSEIDTAERSLKNIKCELEKLLNVIPNDYKVKDCKINLNYAKQHFHGLCGGRCSNRNDHLFSINEDKVFDNIKKVLSFYKENKDAFKLASLKQSCRGTYSKLYKIIELEEYKK